MLHSDGSIAVATCSPVINTAVPLTSCSPTHWAASLPVKDSADTMASHTDLLQHQQSCDSLNEVPLCVGLLDQRHYSQSMTEAKELAYARLAQELEKSQKELKLKDEECEKLSKLRGQMETEINELTASLFEEANKQIQSAHVQRMKAEKLLADSNHQIEVLKQEITALKHWVVTSTPSSPNKHLHPQISQSSHKGDKNSRPFWMKHRRSTSHHEFTKQGRAHVEDGQRDTYTIKEVDEVVFEEFKQWKLAPCVTYPNCPFLDRVLVEDIQPCLNFHNKQLAEQALQCVQQNTLSIEPIPGDSSFPRRCCLSDSNKLCNFKIKLKEDGQWYSISQMCRNRVAAVCEFYAYIRYICQGLVKSPDKDIFNKISRLRLQMSMARLGCC